MVTTIQLNEDTKKTLDKLKVHNRETYDELIRRLAESYSDADKESLVETIDVLSDPETMREIAKGIEEFEKGRTKSWDRIKKELKLNV
jgi:predicted transcriptional regulator